MLIQGVVSPCNVPDVYANVSALLIVSTFDTDKGYDLKTMKALESRGFVEEVKTPESKPKPKSKTPKNK